MSTAIAKPINSSAIGELREPLQEPAKRLLGIWTAAEKNDIMARYEMGHIIRDLRDNEGKYGSDAVEEITAALALDAQQMSDYKSLADTWPKQADMKKLVNRLVADSGRPLSLSHFVALTRVEDRYRPKMIERCFAKALTVRELVALVHEKQGKKGNNLKGRPMGPKSPAAAVALLDKHISQLTKIRDPLLQQLDEIDTSDENTTLANEDFLEKLGLTLTHCDAGIEMLSTARRKLAAEQQTIASLIRAQERVSSNGHAKPTPAKTPAKKPKLKKKAAHAAKAAPAIKLKLKPKAKA